MHHYRPVDLHGAVASVGHSRRAHGQEYGVEEGERADTHLDNSPVGTQGRALGRDGMMSRTSRCCPKVKECDTK